MFESDVLVDVTSLDFFDMRVFTNCTNLLFFDSGLGVSVFTTSVVSQTGLLVAASEWPENLALLEVASWSCDANIGAGTTEGIE